MLHDVNPSAAPPLFPVDLLAELVTIKSCDPPGREIDVAKRLAEELSFDGVASDLDEFAPGRANLFARLPGNGSKPSLVFSAHLDTVPAGTSGWNFEPFGGRIEDGRLYGRGASDMKSGVVAMTAAFIDIASSKIPLAGDLILAFSAGESSNCLGAKRFVERGQFADVGAIIVSEPSSLDLIVAEMGVLWLRVTAHGRVGHISGDPGINAIARMASLISALPSISLPCPDHPLLPRPNISVGMVKGGTAVNVTPDHCSIDIDVRMRPGTAPEDIIRLLDAFEMSVEILDFKPAVETCPNHTFVQTCLGACATESLHTPKIMGVSYYSDATVYSAAYGAPFVIIGPGELGMSGQPDEFVEIEKLNRAIRIYKRIAKTWLSP